MNHHHRGIDPALMRVAELDPSAPDGRRRMPGGGVLENPGKLPAAMRVVADAQAASTDRITPPSPSPRRAETV